MRRLRAAPVGRAPIVISKLAPFYVGEPDPDRDHVCDRAAGVLGLDLGFVPALVVVSAALALVATGLGIALAGVSRSETQGTGLAVIVVLTDVGTGRGDGAALHHAGGDAADRATSRRRPGRSRAIRTCWCGARASAAACGWKRACC